MSADWNEWYAPMNMISETGFTMVDLTYFGIQPDGSPGSNYITSIEFWWNSEEDSPTINSARMTFSDGTSTEKNWLTGNFDQFLTWPGAKSQRFDFQGGERLKSMRISRRSNPGFNGISLSTVFGRDWTLVADSTVAGAPPPDHPGPPGAAAGLGPPGGSAARPRCLPDPSPDPLLPLEDPDGS